MEEISQEENVEFTWKTALGIIIIMAVFAGFIFGIGWLMNRPERIPDGAKHTRWYGCSTHWNHGREIKDCGWVDSYQIDNK